MARRRRRRDTQSAHTPRIARDPLADLLPLPPSRRLDALLSPLAPLTDNLLADRRLFSPTVFAGPSPLRNRNVDRSGVSQAHASIVNQHAEHDHRAASVCVRRKERKEVLHALKKAGRGGGGRPRRLTDASTVKC